MRYAIGLAVSLVVSALALGCGSSHGGSGGGSTSFQQTTTTTTPPTLAKVSGDGQTITSGQSIQLTVNVTDNGIPEEGDLVNFAYPSGAYQTVASDANGNATGTFNSSGVATGQTVITVGTANAAGNASPVYFTETIR